MYKCRECGHLFVEGEESVWKEDRGEFWGVPCDEQMSGCPVCNGGYEECEQCQICGSYHFEEDLTGGVCDDCIEEYTYDLDTCVKVGDHFKESIELNCFFTTMFTAEDIEDILYQYLKADKFTDCSDFIDSDRGWFAEELIREIKG